MYLLALTVIILQVSASKIEDTNEKLIRVWKDRVQNTELDANELNFPLFLEENEKPPVFNTVGFSIAEDTQITDTDFPADDNENLDQKGSFMTLSHKITDNNVTNEGITTIPMSAVMPFLKTALDSLSIEDTMVLALGGLLPLIMFSMPFVIIITVVPLLIVLVFSLCSIFTSVLFFTPLALFGFGLYATADSVFENPSDKISSFDLSTLEKLPSFEDIETISEKISQEVELNTNVDEDYSFQTTTNSVPRSFFS